VPGPGGPCSEIYIDRGPAYGPDGGPIVDEDRFLEIWNLVFQTEDLSVVRAKDDFDISAKLPTSNIDTGAGLERAAYLLQGVENLYEIDQVFPVIARASELARKPYGKQVEDDIRMRVVADHIRSALMLITDGVTPGNEARGYVLRRLLRRSMRSMRLLGVMEPTLLELLSVSRDQMVASYPEIAEQWPRIVAVAGAEEETFSRTLASGTQLFDLAVTKLKATKAVELPGDKAFQLHDTYGFPIDLTLEMAEEAGITVDKAGFQTLMAEQKARAKADAKAKKGNLTSQAAYGELRRSGESQFLGFTDLTVTSRVLGLIKNGQAVSAASVGDEVEIQLGETPFYAEAGGQDSDSGLITAAGLSVDIVDVQEPIPGLIVHRGVITDGTIATGAEVVAAVDGAARFGACQAHTATHLINAGLRQLLGQATHQAGSYNKPGYLRFDFNALAGLSEDQKQELEGVVNQAIRADWAVTASQMSLDQAKALGAQAMFGEKYGEIVRVVELAGPWSRELCGGTHVQSTSQIGLLSLISEGSIGSGVRRLEALVSTDAFDHLAAERALVANLANTLKVQPAQLEDRVAKLLVQLKQAEKAIADLKAAQAGDLAKNLVASALDRGGIRFVAALDPDVADLRSLANEVRGQLGSAPAVVALIATTPKPTIVVATTAAARERGLGAGRLVSLAAAAMGGRGGGSDDLAQGGGTDPAAAPQALEVIGNALG
jgi:alanyl-tRNA synthetase